MDTLAGIQRLAEQAKQETCEGFEITRRVMHTIQPNLLKYTESPPGIYKLSAGICTAAAGIALMVIIRDVSILTHPEVGLFVPLLGVWPW